MNARIDLKDMLRRQMIFPLDCDWLAPQRFEGWARIMSLISPQPGGWKLRMQLLGELQHANPILSPALARAFRHQSFWDRQRIDITLQRGRLAIDRQGSRMARCCVRLSALRKDKSRYRCKAQFEEVTPLFQIQFTSRSARLCSTSGLAVAIIGCAAKKLHSVMSLHRYALTIWSFSSPVDGEPHQPADTGETHTGQRGRPRNDY